MRRKRALLIAGCLAAVLVAGYATLWLTAPMHLDQSGKVTEKYYGVWEDEPFLAKLRRWLRIQ